MANPSNNRDAVHKPLHPKDTAEQTFGCRRAEPYYCYNYEAESVCAWIRADKMCLCPPQRWHIRYEKMKKPTR